MPYKMATLAKLIVALNWKERKHTKAVCLYKGLREENYSYKKTKIYKQAFYLLEVHRESRKENPKLYKLEQNLSPVECRQKPCRYHDIISQR
jgi:triosephosphate isomerase